MTASRRRGLMLVVAALAFAFAFALSGSAEAKKKKKPAKHHKTPSGKSTGGSSKAAPEPEEESSDSGAGKKEEEPEEAKAPPPKPPAPAEGEGEGTAGGEGEAPKASKKKKVVTEAPEGEAAGGEARSALELFVGAGAVFRNLAWNQNASPTLIVPYTLSPGPEAIVALEAYPGAFFTPGFGGNIGLFGHFNYGFAVVSKTPAGVSLTTHFQDFLIGLKLRIPLGMVDPFGSIALGGQTFRLDGQSPVTVPGVSYSFTRFGLGLRVHLAPIVTLDAGGAYLLVGGLGSSTGDIAAQGFFPNAAGYAAEGSLSVRLRLTSLIALRAGGDFRQYGLSLHAAMGAQPYVGGAADRYIVGWGGVELVFDGLGGGGAASDDEKPAPPPPTKKAKARRQPEPDLSDDAAE